jgi:hypothetical protein
MIRRLFLIAALFLSSASRGLPAPALSNFVVAKAPVDSGSLQLFASEATAQAHCPKDTVVWLNTNSGIYHEKGMRWYGTTKHGAYVCRKEADAAGDRDTRNGQ